MLLDFWFAQELPLMMALLVLLFGGFALFLAWLAYSSPVSAFLKSCKGIAPPFVNVAAVLFALMLTFLSQDIWEANRQGKRAVTLEREQLMTMRSLSEEDGVVDKDLRAAIHAYVKAVVHHEWRAMETSDRAPEASAALDALTRVVGDTVVNASFKRSFVDAVIRLRAAREQRLAIASSYPDQHKWSAVFLLALLTQIGIAMIHLDNRRAQLAAQAIFGAAATITLSLVASVEAPFVPPVAIHPGPLLEVMARIPAD